MSRRDPPRRRMMGGATGSLLPRGLFTSSTWEWNTPPDIRAAIDAEFGTEFDPCPPVPAQDLRAQDGLSSWHGRVFCNPPYGRELPKWLAHGVRELQRGHCDLIVWLIPARTDARWFHELVLPNAKEIRFLRGRIYFWRNGQRQARAPFPSMLVVMERPK